MAVDHDPKVSSSMLPEEVQFGGFQIRGFIGIHWQMPTVAGAIETSADVQPEKSERSIVVNLLGQLIEWVIGGSTGRIAQELVVLTPTQEFIYGNVVHLPAQIPDSRFDAGQYGSAK